MKKIIKLLICSVLSLATAAAVLSGCGGTNNNSSIISSTAAASDLEYIKSKGTMVIGITEYAPMNYKEDGSDNWTGFDTEFAEKVAEKLGVKAEFFVLGDWGAKVNELNVKTIDCVWNGMTITDELKTSMSISKPYVVNAQVIVCKESEKDKYSSIESIKDVTVAVEQGSAAQKLVADYKNVTPCQNMAGTLLEVKTGAADVAIIDITMAKTMLGEGTAYADLTYTASLSEEQYGIGFRKGSDLCDAVNKIIDELKADGTLTGLAKKYGLTLVD